MTQRQRGRRGECFAAVRSSDRLAYGGMKGALDHQFSICRYAQWLTAGRRDFQGLVAHEAGEYITVEAHPIDGPSDHAGRVAPDNKRRRS